MAEGRNQARIIEIAEIAWEPVTPLVKAKLVWSDPATKRRAQLTRFDPGACLPTDQRGHKRTARGCDIGAIEGTRP